MKKLIFLSALICNSLITFAQYDFGTLSYSEQRPAQMPSDYYRLQAELEAYKQQQRQIEFENNSSNGFACFNYNNYNGCIYYYNKCRRLGWYNSSFDYITGISYYKIGNKAKAKKYLKLSAKRGYYQAEQQLNELFNKK